MNRTFGLILPKSLSSKLIERVEYAFPESELRTFDLQFGGGAGNFRDSLYKPADHRKPNEGMVFKTGLH